MRITSLPPRARAGAGASASAASFRNRLAAALLLALASDWLFHDERPGISVGVFAVLAAIAITLMWRARRTRAEMIRAWGILGLSLLPLVMETTWTSLLFALAGGIVFSLLMTGSVPSLKRMGFFHLPAHLLHSPGFLLRDVRRTVPCRDFRQPLRVLASLIRNAGKLLIPAILAWVFIALFSFANPLFKSLVPSIELSARMLDSLFSQALIMGLTFLAIWGFLRRNAAFRLKAMKRVRNRDRNRYRIRRRFFHRLPMPGRQEDALLWLTLLVFNAIFAVHVVTDLLLVLPAHLHPQGIPGFRYAEYAHAGAYALAAAAVLAGLFVVTALPSGPGAARPSGRVLKLLYLWLAQTLAIALSALVRLDLYVSAYSLTHARIYGFVFIALVCAGVVLIAWRVHAGRSTRWLARACALTAIAMIWGLSIVNLDKMIASYNIAHSREVTGEGAPLDVKYITNSLSVFALPAMFAENGPWRNDPGRILHAAYRINEQLSFYGGWRQWSWRVWRLKAFENELLKTHENILLEKRKKSMGGE